MILLENSFKQIISKVKSKPGFKIIVIQKFMFDLFVTIYCQKAVKDFNIYVYQESILYLVLTKYTWHIYGKENDDNAPGLLNAIL